MRSEHLGARKRWGPPWGFSRSREATLSGDGWAGVNLWVAPTQDGLAKPGCVQSLHGVDRLRGDRHLRTGRPPQFLLFSKCVSFGRKLHEDLREGPVQGPGGCQWSC